MYGAKITRKRLTKEYQMLIKSPNENVTAFPDEKDILKWHFLIYNLKDSPYENGFYVGTIYFPTDYPLKPPHFKMCTPNGRF